MLLCFEWTARLFLNAVTCCPAGCKGLQLALIQHASAARKL